VKNFLMAVAVALVAQSAMAIPTSPTAIGSRNGRDGWNQIGRFTVLSAKEYSAIKAEAGLWGNDLGGTMYRVKWVGDALGNSYWTFTRSNPFSNSAEQKSPHRSETAGNEKSSAGKDWKILVSP